MPTTKRQLTQYGISNVRYAMPGGKVKELPFAQTLTLNTQFSTTALYADNAKQLEVPSDKGYEGTLGLTTIPAEYEEDLGYVKIMPDGSRATLTTKAMKKHALYFETIGVDEDGNSFVMKVWMPSCTVAKPNKTYNTMAESPDFDKAELPLAVYPITGLNADGTPNIDPDTGHTTEYCFRTAKPGDACYENFGDSVPDEIVNP